MDRRSTQYLLHRWLFGEVNSTSRWICLEELTKRKDQFPPSIPTRLLRIIEKGEDGKRKLRRAAAILLIQLHTPQESSTCSYSDRLQSALSRSFALALPSRLSRPHIVDSVLPKDACNQLISEAMEHAVLNGWGSAHRRHLV